MNILELNKSRDIAVGYALGYNDGLGQGGGISSDEWQFPEGWINIPDPSANQIIMMVEIDDISVNQPVLAINLDGRDGQGFYEGIESIDWGDGYIDSMPVNYKPNYGHKYKEKGQYIITINCSSTMNCLNLDTQVWTNGYIDGVAPSTGTNVICNVLRVIIFGTNTALYHNIPTSNSYSYSAYNEIVYLRFKGVFKSYRTGNAPTLMYQHSLCKLVCNILPTLIDNSSFMNCYSLQDVDFARNLTSIPKNAFSDCYGLRFASFPNATEIGSSAFARCYNLKKVNAPLVSTVGNYAFGECRNLQEIIFADGCTIAEDSFKDSHNIYPKP